MATSPKFDDSLTVVNADVEKHARLGCIKHLLDMIGYGHLTPVPMDLPERRQRGGYVRPPVTDQTFVPEHH